MLRNKIVAHYKNHEVVKGISNNFFPNKIFFTNEAPSGESSRIDRPWRVRSHHDEAPSVGVEPLDQAVGAVQQRIPHLAEKRDVLPPARAG